MLIKSLKKWVKDRKTRKVCFIKPMYKLEGDSSLKPDYRRVKIWVLCENEEKAIEVWISSSIDEKLFETLCLA